MDPYEYDPSAQARSMRAYEPTEGLAQKQSSNVEQAWRRMDKAQANLSQIIDELRGRIEPVLHSDPFIEDEPMKAVDGAGSRLAADIHSRANFLENKANALHAILSRIDL